MESIRGGLRGVVIGKVLTCTDHPDSDHLAYHHSGSRLGRAGADVCGAPNVAAGQTVVVATVGTILYDGDKELKIKKSKIRGVESYGMICAEDEIGLGTGHAGIMVLPDGVALPGTPAAEYFNVSSDHVARWNSRRTVWMRPVISVWPAISRGPPVVRHSARRRR